MLFGLYALVSEKGAERRDRIVVGRDRVASLATNFERTWLRPPTAAELDGLIEEYVREEVLYREALALGLDRDDLIVRRRMRQKMEFLNEGLTLAEPPEEAELRAYLEKNAERFQVPPRLSFRQLYLDPNRADAASLDERSAALLERLAANPATDAAALGDPTLLPRGLDDASVREIGARFGDEFAAALLEAPVGRWSGPLRSGYGAHLVQVDRHDPARDPEFEAIRDRVELEWAAEQRQAANERFHQTLRERYVVEIEDTPGTEEAAP